MANAYKSLELSSTSFDHQNKAIFIGNEYLGQFSIAKVQAMKVKDLLFLQVQLQHGTEYGYWSTPASWIPVTQPGLRRIDIKRRIKQFAHNSLGHAFSSSEDPKLHSLLEDLLDHATLVTTRYLIVCRMGPVGMGARGAHAPLDPSTLIRIAYEVFPHILGKCIALEIFRIQSLPASQQLLEQTTEERLILKQAKLSLDDASKNRKRYVNNEIRRMHFLREMGLWSDVPLENSNIRITGEADIPEEQRRKYSHTPYPDDFVSQMGTRSLWLLKVLGPNLINVSSKISMIWEETKNIGKGSIVSERAKRLENFLRTYLWKDDQGAEIQALPFPIRLRSFEKVKKGTKRSSEGAAWPPRTFFQILGLVSNLQMAHLFIVSLAMAARKSESLTLKRDCVQYLRDGNTYAKGRTYKLVERHDGEVREWYLPEVAVCAIEQQGRLADIVGIIEHQRPNLERQSADAASKSLWIQLGNSANSKRGALLLEINGALKRYAKDLYLPTAPGGQSIRSHRFRKTIGRLVALALTQAPKVLMDVFGHKSIEMTLDYILTDPDVRADIAVVSRELNVMRAKIAVETLVEAEKYSPEIQETGGYGGPAAIMLRNSIESFKNRLRREGSDWNADSTAELATILTLDGRTWQLVREGVICTKFPGTESGPCNFSKGKPEPSKCQSNCMHRLEESFLREDVNNTIQEAIEAYIQTGSSGDFLIQSHWAGQILTNIERFQDLKAKWTKNPTVLGLLSERSIEEESSK